MPSQLSVLFVLLVPVPSGLAQARTWTDNTGKHTIEAEFVEVTDGGVRVRKTDGGLIVVPLGRLSQADRQHVQSLSAEPREIKPVTPKAEATTNKTGPAGHSKPVQVKAGPEAIARALGQRANLPQGNIPLTDMVRQLSANHQIPIVLDLRALDDLGLGADTPVTVGGQAALLAETLDGSLKPLRLTWTVDQDVLVITTQEGAERHLEIVVYKLLRPVDFDMLVTDIETKIAPNSWDTVGGPGSCGAWLAGALVIAQTRTLHRQIAAQYAGILARILPAGVKTATRGKSKPTAALAAPATCDYVETPLNEALADLSKKSGVVIAWDAKALADVGIGTDSPITFALQGASLDSTLIWLLRPLGLTWVPDETGLKVTTPKEADKALLTATYDVRDLLMAVRGDVNSLAALVTSAVAPVSWREVGGRGTLTPIAGGGLQIQQTYQVHREIERLLAGLRQASR
jgi:hypothetical protein